MNARALLAAGALFVSSLAGSAFAAPMVFDVDKNHSFFGFKASTVLFDVPGQFDQYKVNITGDPASGGDAKVRIEINARSINTQNQQRDEHLRSPDFFDANQFNKIVFTSSKVVKQGNQVIVDGTLDMHGVKKEVSIPFQEVVAKNGAGYMEHVYKAKINVNRKDFGIGAESVAAKISLADDVELSLLLAGFWEEPKAEPAKGDAAGKAPAAAGKK